MNIPLRDRIVVAVILALIVSAQCYPAKTKKGRLNHRHTVHHPKGNAKSSAKKDSVNQRIMSAVMQPGKLDMSEQRDLDQLQDYNKAYINNEMAAETSLLANQGIDDDSALKISNMAALPGAMDGHASSKKGNGIKGNPTALNKPNTAGYSPDEYLLDANSWPEYRIKDSDYNSRNYRIFPQGGAGGYQGGYMSNAMQYGQRVAAGMEGPYGDGNYGFNAPGGPQMVSDEQEQEQEQDGGPSQLPQEDGSPMASPMTMSPATERIQKLIMLKQQRKMKNAAGMSYGDEARLSDARGGGSGSGSDASGSGTLSHDTKPITVVPEPGRQVENQGKQDNPTKGGEGSGQVTIDTKPDGTIVKTPGSMSQEKQDSSSSPSLPGKTDQQGNTGSKAQENTTPDSLTKIQTSTIKDTGNSSIGKPTTEQVKPESQKGSSDSNNESTHSTLGEFAKFLKSKGITLTINKDKSSSKGQPSQGRKVKDSSESSQPTSPMSHDHSSTSAVLPSTGQATESGGTTTMNITPSQGQSLNNAVMRWQNVSPQANQLGELFLRHKTKPHHH